MTWPFTDPPNYATTWDDPGPDQQRRALTPSRPGSRVVSARTRRSTRRCGWTNFLYQATNPAKGRAVWQKCQARHCGDCGPELRERNLAHDLGNMADHQMIRRVVARSAWPAVRAKIKRAGGLRFTYPQPGGMLAVYATTGMTGPVVADHAAALASDYGRIPDGERICRSREWALNPARKADQPIGWKSLGKSGIPEQVPDALRRLGLYQSEVDPASLSAGAWEAHNFTVPPLRTSAFERFAYEVGLHRSHRGKRRRDAA